MRFPSFGAFSIGLHSLIFSNLYGRKNLTEQSSAKVAKLPKMPSTIRQHSALKLVVTPQRPDQDGEDGERDGDQEHVHGNRLSSFGVKNRNAKTQHN